LNASGRINIFALSVRLHSRQEFNGKEIQRLENWEQVKLLRIPYAIIATDTIRHAADIQSTLECGCSILVEKPMAVNAASAFAKLQEARRLNQDLWVGCCMRFHQALNIFCEHLPRIGEIYSVRIECQSYLPDWRPERLYKDSYSARYDEGGVLRDLIHEIDYAGWLFGWPKSVMANIRNTCILEIPVEETADLLWETQNGVLVSITLDYLSRPPRRQMRAFGRNGILEWDGLRGSVTLSISGEQPQEFRSSQSRDEMYLAQDLAFLNAVSPGDMSDKRLASGADGVRALAICDAARQASQEKREIVVLYPEGL